MVAYDVNVWSALQAGIEMLELAEIIDRPAWQSDAACKEHPGLNWFPERGEDIAPARAVCAGCLVRVECCAFALEAGEAHGVWGGTSNRQRRLAHREGWTTEELLAEVEGRY